ncbi:hypothetical protein V1264_022406 [Littorina saxatilis]|uniref:Uncharacterized protein n=1 Tax=Littorina saxatilis TaxID=31220 RepID=A0AAN9AKA9_9CAEN
MNILSLVYFDDLEPETTKDDSATNLVGPIVGAIIGVGVLMTITGAICWRRKSQGARSSGQNPPNTSSISKHDSAPKGRPEPSPVKQSSSNEKRDPENIYEIYDIESNYEKLSPYSNDDANRDPYMQLTSQANAVKTPASNDAYVNAELSV